jgi:hypothetical protein
MENITKIENEKDLETLNNNVDKIINETVYEDGRDWTEEEISLFVKQFCEFQQKEDVDIDMNRLDPNFISLQDYKEKFSGFDDEVLKYMVKCENKKLEDARVPPILVRTETVTLKDNLSTLIVNGEED